MAEPMKREAEAFGIKKPKSPIFTALDVLKRDGILLKSLKSRGKGLLKSYLKSKLGGFLGGLVYLILWPVLEACYNLYLVPKIKFRENKYISDQYHEKRSQVLKLEKKQTLKEFLDEAKKVHSDPS